MSFTDLIQKRRSRYELAAQIPISEEDLEKILEKCVKYAPSAFNSQSSRVVLLLSSAHKLLWDLTLEALRPLVPSDHFEPTYEKIKSFAKAYGTILYYEDQKRVEELKNQFPLYKERFSVWSEHASAMLQFSVWTALAEAGIGASLQHYNPVIDEEVAIAFHIPKSWKLIAQMPFGKSVGDDSEKTFLPLSVRLRIEK